MSFDFAGGEPHEFGSNLYCAPSGTDDSVSRKFSLLLTAFVAEKRILVNTEGCEDNRMKVGWIRLLKG